MNHRVKNMVDTARATGNARVVEIRQKYRNKEGVISLTAGEPDYDTPRKITYEAIKSLLNGNTRYAGGGNWGTEDLKKAVSEKMVNCHNVDCDPDMVFITPGAKYAIYLALNVLLDDGDEAIILDPSWMSYGPIVESTGAKAKRVMLDYKNDYRITREVLENAYSLNVKAVIMCYPNNPTGRILHRDEAEILKEFMEAHPQVYLISDEIYESIIFDDNEMISMGSFKEIADRVMTVNGFSKCVAMTGWRAGYLICGDRSLVPYLRKLYDESISMVAGATQVGALHAFECGDEIEDMRSSYERRRNLFVDAMNKIDGVDCTLPEGSFYAWVHFDDRFGMSSVDMFEYILKEAKVLGMPATSYGDFENCFIRFSTAASDKDLEDAAGNIKTVIDRLSEQQ